MRTFFEITGIAQLAVAQEYALVDAVVDMLFADDAVGYHRVGLVLEPSTLHQPLVPGVGHTYGLEGDYPLPGPELNLLSQYFGWEKKLAERLLE